MVVIPSCVRDIKLKPASKYCILGEVASEIGWNHFDNNKAFEEKAAAKIAEKKAANTEKYNAACENAEVKALNEELAKYGYGYWFYYFFTLLIYRIFIMSCTKKFISFLLNEKRVCRMLGIDPEVLNDEENE